MIDSTPLQHQEHLHFASGDDKHGDAADHDDDDDDDAADYDDDDDDNYYYYYYYEIHI